MDQPETTPDRGLTARAVQLVRPTWYAQTNADVRLGSEDSLLHFEAFGLREGRDPGPLFRSGWYRQFMDLSLQMSALEHYLTVGASEGNDPCPMFDSAWYQRQLDTEVDSKLTPLEHYLQVGGQSGLSPHPLFNGTWYVERNEGLDFSGLTPYEHYLEIGWRQGLDPSPLFSTNGYLDLNNDVKEVGTNPLVHYVTDGMREGRPSATVFDSGGYLRATKRGHHLDIDRPNDPRSRAVRILRPGWYGHNYPEINDGGHTPHSHFERYGYREGRSPCSLFDPDWYRDTVPDFPADRPALEHYLLFGAAAGFDPCPSFDSRWYARQLTGDLGPNCTPLEHYMTIGWAMGLDPHPLFSGAWYIERSAQLDLDGLTPLEHFLERGWKQGLHPCALFNGDAYLALNEDVDVAGSNPFVHYILDGIREKRPSSTVFDDRWYVGTAGDDPLIRTFDPLSHFVHFGFTIGRKSSPDPIAAALAAKLLDADRRARLTFVGKVEIKSLGTDVGSAWTDWSARLTVLDLPLSDEPLVSVIVPTFNHSEDVIRCMESIQEAGDTTPFEVILVDDESSDEHSERFRRLRGVRLLRLDQNSGFAAACTVGVADARGRYLMLLNNDTEVLPGWLDSLVGELDRHLETGVVGSMIVRPDLLLQEAGCIMWSDGGSWQYGLGRSPLDFQYRYRREVDYCSGASLLVRRSLWDRVGGFDPRFSPAYYEDADLCFAARDAGYSVVYEPRSVVFHNEGTSHGRDGTGIKRYQFRNKERFREKWSTVLIGHGTAQNALANDGLLLARDRRRSKHMLVIDHRVPQPDHDAGSVRMFRIVEGLIEQGYVVHFLPADLTRHDPWTQTLEHMGVEFITGEKLRERHLRAIGSSIDFVIVSRPEVGAEHLTLLLGCLPTVPIVYDMVDAHAQRLRRSATLQGRPDLNTEAARFERLEAALARVSDVVITVSDADEEFIRRIARTPLNTVRIPTVHFAEDHGPAYSQRSGLLFVGGFEHTPNVDAALYLVHELMPLIRERIGKVTLTLAGSKPPAELVRLTAGDVTVTGWVPELRPFYDRARAVVAPLRYGAGVKGKIGEALSFGLPTITTNIGIEGIDVRPGLDILVGDTPQSFADAVAEAYSDEALWTTLRDNGALAIERQFGRTALGHQIEQLLETVSRVDTRSRPAMAGTNSTDKSGAPS